LYKIQLHKIQKISKSEKAVKTKLNQEKKYNKDLLKEIKIENE
jgi:formate-dependent nitrite reductase cytochrome c552 subunit